MSESNLTALNSVAQLWGSWMWSMSWQLLWLVLVLLLLDRLLIKSSARLRHMLWLLVLVRLLLPPDFAAPTGIAWWLSDWMVAANAAATERLETWLPHGGSAPSLANANADATQAPLVEDASARDIFANSAAALTHSGAPSSLRDALTWTCTLFLVWLGIVVARLGLLLYAWMQVRKWLHSAEEITDPTARAALESARTRVGIVRDIRLCDSHACSTPLVTGWLRPVVLLPGYVRNTLNAEELEAVLVHELTHVARGDGWIRLGQALLSAVYFFHPALWLANLFLARTCEDACDEQTIAALSGRRRWYAEAIVKAAAVVGYEPPHLALGMLTDRYPVQRRLRRILDPHLRFSAGGALRRWSIAAVTALLLLPTGTPVTLATLPDQVSLEDVGGLPRETRVNESPLEVSRLETAALAQLDSTDFDERMAAYATLERVGTLRALNRLESAFLERGSLEQDAAKRALDAVWKQLNDSIPSSTSSRLIQEN